MKEIVNVAFSPSHIASPPDISAVGRSSMVIAADAVPVHPLASLTVKVTVVLTVTSDAVYSVSLPNVPPFHE